MKNKIWIAVFVILVFVSLTGIYGAEVCCEKTNYGAFCMTDDNSNCEQGYRITPTSCGATSYCKGGCCYDSKEGICMENTPQIVCQNKNGTWADDSQCNIPQCQLGCCVLGDQAALVSLVRCKKLSSFYGLQTDFRRNINDEVSCIVLAGLQDRGACVYEKEFEITCKMTTRQNCVGNTEIGNESVVLTGGTKFYKDKLCTDEELGTACSPTKETICVEGKDEVYFKDTCGNPANIYDASRITDPAYWKKIISKDESCGYGKDNINSQTCGNCDYLGGSICGEGNAKYGDNVCISLNCKNTYNGKDYRHGESWCMYDSEVGEANDLVGSRYWRHMCVAGEEIVEPCADFRQKICIQDVIKTEKGDFLQAGCVVNRWQDCVAQKEKDDCENTDKRDCLWKEGKVVVNPLVETKKTGEKGEQEIKEGYCVPKYSPGLDFWNEGEAQGICSQASFTTKIEYEKGLVSGESVTEGKEFLEPAFQQRQADFCKSLGDCVVGKIISPEKVYVKEGAGSVGIWTLGSKMNKGVIGTTNALGLVLIKIIEEETIGDKDD